MISTFIAVEVCNFLPICRLSGRGRVEVEQMRGLGGFWGGWCSPAVVRGVTAEAAAAMMSSTLGGWVGGWGVGRALLSEETDSTPLINTDTRLDITV